MWIVKLKLKVWKCYHFFLNIIRISSQKGYLNFGKPNVCAYLKNII